MARPPKTFASFVGQARVVDTLRRLADGARENDRPVPHLLLAAPAGLGKTSLATALARYAGTFADGDDPTNLHVVQAGRGSIMQIHRVLRETKPADFVFIDEAHALAQQDAELLYVAIDSAETLGLTADGRLDRTAREAIAPATIVLATNQPGRVPKALASRAVTLELDPYSQRELCAIAQRVAAHHGVDLTAQAARIVAERAGGSPRRVEQMLLLLDSVAPQGTRLTQPQVEGLLAKTLGYDEHGLSPNQRRLLKVLATAGAMRAEQIVNHFGLDPAYVRSEIEGPLVVRGLMSVTGNHVRQLTATGLALVPSSLVEDEEDISEGEDLAS
jgi:Holliday junction resolvasome RuvABC ATP-dependent DNA helicase subunit